MSLLGHHLPMRPPSRVRQEVTPLTSSLTLLGATPSLLGPTWNQDGPNANRPCVRFSQVLVRRRWYPLFYQFIRVGFTLISKVYADTKASAHRKTVQRSTRLKIHSRFRIEDAAHGRHFECSDACWCQPSLQVRRGRGDQRQSNAAKRARYPVQFSGCARSRL